MMKIATRIVPLLLLALAWPAVGCAVPLPAPQLTATAESQIPVEKERSGSVVQSASSGAPSSSALSLQTTSDERDPPSALAPLEDDELVGATPEVDESVDDAAIEETPEPTVAEEAPLDTPTPEEPTATPVPEVDSTLYPAQMVDLLNQVRLERGLDILQFDATLSQAAMGHAQYMATNNFFGHYPPTGTTPSGRIAAAGFTGIYQGEALSAGQASPAIALSRLLGSPAHAAILLSSKPTLVGVGYYYDASSYYRSYWVVVTANP
jgi:uncharacterized protein YkwD